MTHHPLPISYAILLLSCSNDALGYGSMAKTQFLHCYPFSFLPSHHTVLIIVYIRSSLISIPLSLLSNIHHSLRKESSSIGHLIIGIIIIPLPLSALRQYLKPPHLIRHYHLPHPFQLSGSSYERYA